MSFSNYNLISISNEKIIEFSKHIAKQKKELYPNNFEPINIAITNLYYMLDINHIQHYIKRYNVNIIPAYRIDTLDNISLIILNPTNSGLSLLKTFQEELKFRLNLILNELLNKFNIYINLTELTEINEINEYEITEIHLCEYLLYLIQEKLLDYKYNNIKAIYDNILSDLYQDIPLTKYLYNEIISKLVNEFIILQNPDKHLNLINQPEICGIIQTPFTPIDIIQTTQNLGKEIFPGTGEYI